MAFGGPISPASGRAGAYSASSRGTVGKSPGLPYPAANRSSNLARDEATLVVAPGTSVTFAGLADDTGGPA